MDEASGSGGSWSGSGGRALDEARLVLDVGTRVGRYVIRRRLARLGGMSDVFEAEHVELGQRVALKVLHPRAAAISHDEPQLTARINHPNIVTIHETGVFRGRVWLALEFIDGPSLSVRLAEGGLSVAECLGVARDMADAVVRAHDEGLLHCDLKPSNIILTPEGRAKVVDFGLAGVVSTRLAPRGGTPGYMAPEVFNGEVSKATDVWGLCRLIDDLFGRRPGSVPVPMPASLEAVVAKGRRINPDRRPDAQTVRDAVAGVLDRMEALGWLRANALQGRTVERRRLVEALDDLDDVGRVIYVEGAAGIGKSVLVADFAVEASARATVLYGQAEPVGRGTPFSAWRPLLRRALGAHDLLDLARLQAALPADVHPHVGLLTSVLEQLGDATTPAPGRARVDALMAALVEVVALVVQGRTVLILEDTHWMDSASWRLAHRVAHRLNVLMVLVSRPTEGPGPWQLLDEMPRVQGIELRPLDDEAMARSLSRRGGKAVDSLMLSRILSTAAGNPYLAGTLLLEAQETQPLSRPVATLEAALHARLSRLSPGARAVLDLAAVFGLRVPRAALEGVAERAAEGELAAHQLLRVEAEELRWDHALAQSVAYSAIATETRRGLHARAARWLDAHRPDDDAALAHHYTKAEVPARALYHADRAGYAALAAGAYDEAELFFEQCLSLSRAVGGASTDTLLWRLALAEVATGLGMLSRRAHHARAALRAAGGRPPGGRARMALEIAGCALRLLVRRVAPHADALAQARARAYGHLAVVHWFRGQLLGLVHAQFHGLLEGLRGGRSPVLARAGAQFASMCGVVGLAKLATRRHAWAQALARTLPQRDTLAFADLLQAITAVGRGAWHHAQTALDEAQGIWEAAADHTQWRDAQNVRFWWYFYQGRDAEAEACLEPMIEQARVAGHRQHLSWGLRGQALLALRAGSPAQALGYAQAAHEALDAVAPRTDQVSIEGALALAWLRQGNPVRALDHAQQVLQLVTAAGPSTSHAVLEGLGAAVEVFNTLEVAGWPTGREMLEPAVACLRGMVRAFPIAEPRAWLWRGVLEARAGRHGKAGAAWRHGLVAANRLGLAPDVARLEARCRSMT